MTIHWDRWHHYFAGIISRGWLDRKTYIWSQETRLSPSMMGKYQAMQDSEVILCRSSRTYPKTWRFYIKQGSFGTNSESQVQKYISLAGITSANLQPAACVGLVSCHWFCCFSQALFGTQSEFESCIMKGYISKRN